MFVDQPINYWVNRKLVAAGMDAELECIGEPEFADGKGNDAQVLVKLLSNCARFPT